MTHIKHDGHTVLPRGLATKEVLGLSTTIDMNYPVLTVIRRKLGYRFMCAEAWWILTGSNNLFHLTQYAPGYMKYSDDGYTLNGAYGPKVLSQLQYVYDTLKADVGTRQAVMTLWERNPGPSKDIPCTIGIQFLIRGWKLYTIVSMRSSDIWLGYPYDMFSFSMISAYLCIELRKKAFPGLGLGDLQLTAGSQHLYERNFRRANKVIDNWYNPEQQEFECRAIDLDGFETGQDLIKYLELLKDEQYDTANGNFLHDLRPDRRGQAEDTEPGEPDCGIIS